MKKTVIILSALALMASNCGQAARKQTETASNETVIEQISDDEQNISVKQTETADKKITIEQNSKKLEAVVSISMENGEENFNVFLEKFGTDSLFQVSRIVSPLEVIEYEWDEDGNMVSIYDDEGNYIDVSVITHTINVENHRFLDGFASNSTPFEIYGYEYPTESDIEAFMAENEYYAEIMVKSTMRLSADEYFVHFFAIEACGRTGYHFKKDENGQWYLVEIDAKST
jgi:hypothetical protein